MVVVVKMQTLLCRGLLYTPDPGCRVRDTPEDRLGYCARLHAFSLRRSCHALCCRTLYRLLSLEYTLLPNVIELHPVYLIGSLLLGSVFHSLKGLSPIDPLPLPAKPECPMPQLIFPTRS